MRNKLQTVIRFLMGESALEGIHFCEKHPTKAGAYWWRLNLRAAVHEAQVTPDAAEVQDAFEKWFAGEQFAGRSEQMALAWRAAVEWMESR